MSWKDRAAQIFIIILSGLILYGVDVAGEKSVAASKFAQNAAGIAYEAIGFLLILWASKTKVHLKASAITEYVGDK
ncbi:MAG: hypothetical protein ACRENO_02130 [Thermodesulfobacteriota bacterium]